MDPVDTSAREPMGTQSWLGALAAELPKQQPNRYLAVTIPVMVRECQSWVLHAPATAWDRRANGESLLADIEAALQDAGPRFRAVVGKQVSDLCSFLQRLISSDGADRLADIDRLGRVLSGLADRVTSMNTRRAAWMDVVEAARDDDADLTVVWHRTALLSALLDMAGADPDAAFR
jgi:acyl carrier protein phosphodiesterase